MNKYRAISKMTFKSILNYKASVVILGFQFTTQFIVMIFLWQAVFKNSSTINGYSFDEMLRYYFGVTLLSYFCFYAIDWEVNGDIHSGSFGHILLKPVSILSYYFFRMIGDRLANILFAAIPVGIIASMFFRDTAYQENILDGLLACIPILLAIVLWFLLSFCISMLAFWLENIFFVLTVKEILIQFCSGILVPISFFPKMLQNLLSFLPFKYIAYEPMQIFNGDYDLYQTLTIIAIQLIWMLVLWLLSKRLLSMGLKKYTNVSG